MNTLYWLVAPILIAARKTGSLVRVRMRLARAKVAIGQGMVEYALILALIAIVTVGILHELGGKTSHVFSSVNCTLGGGAVASSDHPGDPRGVGTGIENNTNTTGGC